MLSSLAVWTGLEPATPCVTGRYSNQLNYHTFVEVALEFDFAKMDTLMTLYHLAVQ